MVDFKRLLPKKEEEDEYLWSLLIEPGWVQAGIWKVEDNKAKVILTSPTTPWNMDEDLMSASDTALSSAIQGFPEDLNEPSKTVFGVPANWVNKGQIGEEHLEKIKKLCTELSLSPIGFVVLPEALAHYKKSSEGTPLNAVTLGIYKESLEISVFSMGNLMGTSQVARSVSLEDDVSEGLARFASTDSLPSRFLLYNGKEGELEDARQSLLKVNWEDFDKIKILHTPKIEITDVKTKVYAVCLAGASELAGVTSLEIADAFLEGGGDETKPGRDLDGSGKSDSAILTDDDISLGKLSSEQPSETDVEVASTEDRGGAERNDQTIEDLGFVIGKDITSDTSTPNKEEREVPQEIESYHENIEPVQEKRSGQQSPFSFGKGFKENIKKLKSGLFSLIPSLKIPKGSGASTGKKIFMLGPLFLILILASGFAAWWFLPKATVTIYLSPQKLGENSSVSIDTKRDSSDLSRGILAGESVAVSLSGEKTKDTTGTKTVGDRAKGEVTLYRVGPEIALASDTVINGPEGLKFTLDSDITIASGSASSPGTTKVNVTAQDIGAQYNLAGGTSFGVANYSSSDIEAKNEDSFSGGSSREINAVSAEDQKVLEEDLLEELSDQTKTKLIDGLSKEKYFIENSIGVTVSSKNFSAKEGDEASTLKLSMEVRAEAVLIEKDTLNEYALQYLNEKVPQGYVLREEQISFEFEFQNENDGLYEFKVRISANLLPEIDKEEIAGKLKGRYTNLAEDYLNREVSGFVRAEIKIRPNLPDKLKTLPHVVRNIEIEFAAEK
jgi:hypothetical protein